MSMLTWLVVRKNTACIKAESDPPEASLLHVTCWVYLIVLVNVGADATKLHVLGQGAQRRLAARLGL